MEKNFNFDQLLRKDFAVTFFALIIAISFGTAIPYYLDIFGIKLKSILILPIILTFIILLAIDRKIIFSVILLFRSSGDIFLETTKTHFGSMSIGVGALINIIVMIIAFFLVLENPKLFPKKLSIIWLPFMAITMSGVVYSPDKVDAIRTYLTLFSYFTIFIIAIYLVRTPDDFNKSIRLVIWSSVFPVIYGVIDIALNMRSGLFRLQGTFSHPNIFAFYLVLVITLSLYLVKTKITPLKAIGRLCVIINMVVMLAELLLTQTRSAWVACLIIFICYAIIFERKYFFYLSALPIVFLSIPSVRNRLANLDSSNEVYQYAALNSFSWRVSLWESALRWMEAVRYVAGYGLDAFRYHSRTFFSRAGGTNWGAHNVYVQLIFETGILGLISFLALFINIASHIKEILKKEALGFYFFMALIIEYLVVAASDNTLGYLVFNWYFWFTLGAGCSLISFQSNSIKNYK